MVNAAVPVLPALPWPVDGEASLVPLAEGAIQPPEVLQWQAQAEAVPYAHAGGQLVWHRWRPQQPNGRAPVVLFHGGSGSWTHWVRSLGPLTAAGHEVWAVDLPGFGASDGVPGAVDADDLIEVLAQSLENLFPLQPVQLVGFSFGGMTAGLLAAAHPHLVEQLVLVGAPGTGIKAPRPHRLKGWRHLPTAREQLACHVFNLGELMLHQQGLIDRDTVALHVANVQRDRLPRRRISSTDVLVRAMEHIDCPVTAIYGDQDALYVGVMDQVEALMAARTRHWRGMVQVAGAGHWVQYEAPQAFHAALLPVLAHVD